jgi:hypothetical protein
MNRYRLASIWISGMAFGMALPMAEDLTAFLFFAGFSVAMLAGAFRPAKKPAQNEPLHDDL